MKNADSILSCFFSLFLSGIFFLFFSCDYKQDSEQKTDSPKKKITLSYHNMFDLRTVQRARRDISPDDIKLASKLLTEGLERKKKRQFARSSDLLKKSVTTNPGGKSYYHLGEVSLELNQTHIAISCFKMAEYLNYSDHANLYISLSKAFALQNDLQEATKYLILGLEKGYSDLNSIAYDPSFKSIKNTPEYREAVADVVQDEKTRKLALFQMFITKFPEKQLPFVLDEESIENFDYEHYIPYDFKELLISRFRKDDSREFSFVAKVDSTDKYIAVIYSSINAIEDDYPAAVEHFLVIYDNFGNIIDNTIFACICRPEITVLGEINEAKEIKITQYQNVWKYDPSTTEYIENELDTTIVKSKKYLKISKEGKLKEIKKQNDDEGIVARI